MLFHQKVLHVRSKRLLIRSVVAAFECALKFWLEGEPVRYQWHNIWGAAVAIVAMCVADGKNGRARIDGMYLELLSCWTC